MLLPYVIDNRANKLADVLNDLLQGDAVRALDVATAAFNVGVTRAVVVSGASPSLEYHRGTPGTALRTG